MDTAPGQSKKSVTFKGILSWLMLGLVPAFIFPVIFSLTGAITSKIFSEKYAGLPGSEGAGFGIAIGSILISLITAILIPFLVGAAFSFVFIKKKRLLAFGVVILSVTGGYWLTSGPLETTFINLIYKPTYNLIQISHETSGFQKEVNIPDQDETSNWNIYNDKDKKYSIGYPINWEKRTDENGLVHFTLVDNTENRNDYYVAKIDKYHSGENFSILTKKTYGSLKPEIKTEHGRKIAKAIVPGHPDKYYSVLIEEGNRYVWVVFVLNPDDLVNQEKLLDEVISTFKFMDQ